MPIIVCVASKVLASCNAYSLNVTAASSCANRSRALRGGFGFEDYVETVITFLQVLGPGTVRVACEAASGFGWERWLGEGGGFVGMAGFGASAPAPDLYKHFGITAEAIVAAVKARL